MGSVRIAIFGRCCTLAVRYSGTRRYIVADRNRNVLAPLKSPDDVQRELINLRRQPGGAE